MPKLQSMIIISISKMTVFNGAPEQHSENLSSNPTLNRVCLLGVFPPRKKIIASMSVLFLAFSCAMNLIKKPHSGKLNLN